MIKQETIISGTEEELLSYFKNKYNLIEREVQEVATILNKFEQSTASHSYATLPAAIPPYGAGEDVVIEELPTKTPINGAQVGNKITTGMNNLFAGTTWSN
jgi:hypothetical protein